MLLYNNVTGLIMSRVKPDAKAQAIANANDEYSVVSESGYEGQRFYINGSFVNNASEEIEAELYENDLNDLRNERNILLAQSDWTQSPDSPLSDSKKTEWATYRQQLRDFPSSNPDLANPIFPTKPE